jgi:hypothetical protein
LVFDAWEVIFDKFELAFGVTVVLVVTEFEAGVADSRDSFGRSVWGVCDKRFLVSLTLRAE